MAKKHNLPLTPAIHGLLAEARQHAREKLKEGDHVWFEGVVQNLLALQHLKEGHLIPNPKCKACIGRGTINKVAYPGKPTKDAKLYVNPCSCIMGIYLENKPKDEVILPPGEYGKPLEKAPAIPEPKPKAKTKRAIPTGGKSPDGEPKKAPRVRKNKSSIPDQGKD